MKKLNNNMVYWLLVILFIFGNVHARNVVLNQEKLQPSRSSSSSPPPRVSAIFVFGDSSVDTGNNNYLTDIRASKGNKPPYGKDFVNHTPTGRFSNGRLIPDFLASYLGVKEFVPPYLDPTLTTEDLMTGVCFASGGSGYDPLTAQLNNVISMSKQLDYFKEYKTKLEQRIGQDRTRDIVKEAVFIISCGDNDFILNYFVVPIRRQIFTTPGSYEQFILKNMMDFVNNLMAEGARKIAVAGVAPMGCFPVVINLYSNNPFENRGCIDSLSSVAVDYNARLQEELRLIQNSTASTDTIVVYIDIYNPIIEMVKEPKKFGYEDVNSGCCGTGPIKVSFSCDTHSYVCPDTSKYLYWDAIHPTEKAYRLIFDSVVPMINKTLR